MVLLWWCGLAARCWGVWSGCVCLSACVGKMVGSDVGGVGRVWCWGWVCGGVVLGVFGACVGDQRDRHSVPVGRVSGWCWAGVGLVLG